MRIISEEQLKHKFSLTMRHFMANRSISENELSKITEISQSAINRIKNAQVCPSLFQAVVIANAFGNKIEDFINLHEEDINTLNYSPIISSNDLLGDQKARVVGFIENNEGKETNAIGFTVDKNFDCKILNNDTIVMVLMDENSNYIEGDTILFLFKKKYMIGTIQQKIIKPLDNLLLKIDLNNCSIVGKVTSIETKYIKDKSLVDTILKKFNIQRLNNTLTQLNNSIKLHLV